MELVVIESPYKGENPSERERNIRYLYACMKDSINRGEAPYASHALYTQILNEEDDVERTLGIEMGLLWGANANLVAVYADLGLTDGMKLGIQRAEQDGRRVVFRFLPNANVFKEKQITLDDLLFEVANRFGVSPDDVKGKCRDTDIIIARHVYCALAWTVFPNYSVVTIGKLINKDHATVLFALKRVASDMELRKVYEKWCREKKLSVRYYENDRRARNHDRIF